MNTRDVLRQHFQALQKEVDELEAKSAPLRAERDALAEKLAPIMDEMRKLAERIKELEQPALADAKNELARVAKALGGRSMSDTA